ncbi:MAG: DNA double-strand break repair nuclease NurA, partial [Anaerolineales bacterium]
MALELNKLMADVTALSGNAQQRLEDMVARLPAARAILQTIDVNDEALHRKIRAAGNRWAGAIPTEEAVNRAYPLPPHPARANVLAADGSQIYPDRHGVALYYLINVGSLVFRYGSSQTPLTHSQPQVFFEDADLYDEDGGQIPAQRIDVVRDTHELSELARLAKDEIASAPTLALLDNGLLLYFSLQAQNRAEIDEALRPYLQQLDELKASGAAVAGVVDRPRASSVLRLLHLYTLPLDEVDQHAESF